MAKGLRVPVGCNEFGQAALVEGDNHADTILAMAINDDDNAHAWQTELGIGIDMIFDSKDLGVRAKISARISKIFREFERLALYKLVAGSMAWDDSVEGELTLSFQYVNLESDEVKSFAKRLTQAR